MFENTIIVKPLVTLPLLGAITGIGFTAYLDYTKSLLIKEPFLDQAVQEWVDIKFFAIPDLVTFLSVDSNPETALAERLKFFQSLHVNYLETKGYYPFMDVLNTMKVSLCTLEEEMNLVNQTAFYFINNSIKLIDIIKSTAEHGVNIELHPKFDVATNVLADFFQNLSYSQLLTIKVYFLNYEQLALALAMPLLLIVLGKKLFFKLFSSLHYKNSAIKFINTAIRKHYYIKEKKSLSYQFYSAVSRVDFTITSGMVLKGGLILYGIKSFIEKHHLVKTVISSQELLSAAFKGKRGFDSESIKASVDFIERAIYDFTSALSAFSAAALRGLASKYEEGLTQMAKEIDKQIENRNNRR